MHLGRQVLKQKSKHLVNRAGIYGVIVVEDEDKIVRDGNNFIEQVRKQG